MIDGIGTVRATYKVTVYDSDETVIQQRVREDTDVIIIDDIDSLVHCHGAAHVAVELQSIQVTHETDARSPTYLSDMTLTETGAEDSTALDAPNDEPQQ